MRNEIRSSNQIRERDIAGREASNEAAAWSCTALPCPPSADIDALDRLRTAASCFSLVADSADGAPPS